MTKQPSKMEQRYRDLTPKSRELFDETSRYLVGGESSTGFMSPYPSYVTHGEGCYLYDVDGRRLVDFVNGTFVLPLGHNHPAVRRAIEEQVARGTMFTFPSVTARDLARELVERIPSIDRLRFAASGSEAVMFAVRMARIFTGRTKIAKMQGGYHGTVDPLWIGVAGEPGPLAGTPDFPGMAPGTNESVVMLPFNHAEECVRIIEEHAGDLAIVAVEPIMGSTGMIPPRPGFLEALREVTARHGVVLLFDEMISFSVARGGAQEHYGVTPDMTTTGKAIGGGMPLAVFGGRADIMEIADLFARSDRPRVVQLATYGAHPVSLAAGYAAVRAMTPDVYAHLHRLGDRLRQGLIDLFSRLEAPMQVSGVGHLFGIYWTPDEVWDYRTASASNHDVTTELSLSMINRGYFMSHRARGCLSAAMTEEHVDGFIDAMEASLAEIELP